MKILTQPLHRLLPNIAKVGQKFQSCKYLKAKLDSICFKYYFNCSRIDVETLKTIPNYDYLADIQDILLEMDESSASEILVLLGEELITSCCTGIIERAFRCLGTELQEFLGSLDGVYDVLKLQEVACYIFELL